MYKPSHSNSKANQGKSLPSSGSTVGIKTLNIYPVKSCAGISVDSAILTKYGLEYDRRYAIGSRPPKGANISDYSVGGGQSSPAASPDPEVYHVCNQYDHHSELSEIVPSITTDSRSGRKQLTLIHKNATEKLTIPIINESSKAETSEARERVKVGHVQRSKYK